MQTYQAKIRLDGSLYNEVVKTDLTAAEITVLRTVHAQDAVVDIKPGKHVDRTDLEERDRLEGIYGRAVRNIKGVGTLNALLGVPGVPLPQTIPGVDSLPAPRSGRRAAAPVPAPEPEPIGEAEFA